MRALDLDFIQRRGRLGKLGYVLLAVAVAGAAYLGQIYVETAADLETWEAKWRSLQKVQRKNAEPGSGQKAEWEKLQAELKAANRVIGRLSTPWDALFSEVEASMDEQVTLLSVEPDTEKRELRILAEAKTMTAMLDYVKRLRGIPMFKDAHMLNHQIQQQDPQRPVRFTVTAAWRDVPAVQPAAAAVVSTPNNP